MENRPGLQVVAGRAARRFGICFYDLYCGEGDLRSLPESTAPSLETHVRRATHEDLDTIIRWSGVEVEGQFDHNLAIGSTCYVAVRRETIAGYLWANREILDLVGMRVAELPPRSSFVHSVFVFPKHRRQGIFRFLFRATCHELQRAGCLTVACLVDKANRRSVEAFMRAGMRFRSAAVLKLPGVKPLFFCRALSRS